MMVVLLGPDLTTGIGMLRRGRDLDFDLDLDFDRLRPASVPPSGDGASGAEVNVGRDVSRRLVLWGPDAAPAAFAAVPPAIASRKVNARPGESSPVVGAATGGGLGGAVTAAGECSEADADADAGIVRCARASRRLSALAEGAAGSSPGG
jgi:hypothetical protein